MQIGEYYSLDLNLEVEPGVSRLKSWKVDRGTLDQSYFTRVSSL